ncbi:MAG: hypothetical protein JWM95_849 [Gemmatimonadetes bacterium]|nr:hypothetical protein [Gemmatimonadota bacterium]
MVPTIAVSYLSPLSLQPFRMRSVIVASLFALTSASVAQPQALKEYRPEIILTLPRVHGFGLQLVLDDRLSMDDVIPNERIMGGGIVSPVFHGMSLLMEAKQVRERDGTFEHRYVPTLYANVELPAGFELRNRNRWEIRDIKTEWSHRLINRSAIGHTVMAAGHPFFPYGQVDVFYDTRYGMLNRHDFTVGMRTPLLGATSIDPFFTRTIDIRRTPRLALTTGAILRVPL